MLHSILEALLRHQAITFGVAGVVIAAGVIVVLLRLEKLELSRSCRKVRRRRVERAST